MEALLTPFAPLALPRPERGRSLRVRAGAMELVLEAMRGGLRLLCLDGSETRNWVLGLPDDGELSLCCRVPRTPIVLAWTQSVVLAPGGRVHAYAQAPLVPTLVLDHAGQQHVLTELLPRQLQAEWDARAGTCVQRWPSPLAHRLPPPGCELRAMVPLTLCNVTTTLQTLTQAQVEIHDSELRSLRGHAIAAPRRLSLGRDGAVATYVRGTAWVVST
jgi:hypothetical protein